MSRRAAGGCLGAAFAIGLVFASVVNVGCSQRREPEPTESASDGPAKAPTTSEAPAKTAEDAGSSTAPAETGAARAEEPSIDLLRAVPAEVTVSSAFRDDVAQAERLCDGDLETAWNSKTGDLSGAWIELSLPSEASVAAVELTAGYTKMSGTNDLFTGNHRVRQVKVTRDESPLGVFDLDINVRELQRIPVKGGGGTYRIELVQLVPGSRPSWREAVMSELRVLGNAPDARPDSRRPTFHIATAEEATDAGADAGGGADALDDADEAEALPTAELHEADGIRITELVVATAVENATPIEPRGTFSAAVYDKVYCFVRLQNLNKTATQIYLGWERPGEPSSDRGREVQVPARPRFGTYAFIGTGHRSGPFQCVIRSAKNTVLGRIDFEITE